MRFAASIFLLLTCSVPVGIAQESPAVQEIPRSVQAAMPADWTPAFEVATIKPSDPDRCCDRTFSRNGRRFATTNTNLKYLIQWAYNLQAKQIVGGPAWLDQDRFNVAGEMEGTGAPVDRQWKLAVQKLLADRFQLKVHHEIREMPAYVLVVARGGPKLVRDDGDPNVQNMGFSGAPGQTMHGHGRNASIADFIGELQRIVLDRPIVDRTGLTGTFKFDIAFTREDPLALGMTTLPDGAAPNLLDALPQQLGLKFDAAKAPVDVLVIDSAEKPSDN